VGRTALYDCPTVVDVIVVPEGAGLVVVVGAVDGALIIVPVLMI